MGTRSIFSLPKLPYPVDEGVGGFISPEGLDLHYNKHHQTYVNNANKLVNGTQWEGEEDPGAVAVETADSRQHAVIFNNCAQIYNHTFFFEGLSPEGGQPSASMLEQLDLHFGGLDKFKERFSHNAIALFGSGWTWLVLNDGQLEITNTFNAGTPLTSGVTPLLCIDAWEHAYYPTHQNKRPDYVKAFWDVIDWSKVEQRLDEARSK